MVPIESDAARALIAARREVVTRRIADLERRLRSIRDVRGEWTDEEHDPEGFTTVFEWSQAEGSRAEHLVELTDLDRAESRVRNGTYGTCVACREAIPLAQLERRPARTACVACADGRR